MSRRPEPGARIAVVGAGVAGIVTAALLQRRYRVTLFDADSRLGGHTNTVRISSGPDAGLGVDTGFIVLNDKNYPLFTRFLRFLDVPIRYSDMSFSYECRETGFTYAGTTLNGLFAQRRNLFSPSFYRFLREIARFASDGRNLLSSEAGFLSMTHGEFLARGRFSGRMKDQYLLPMGAAIWSAPPDKILDFPAASILQFFHNHGLLSVRDRPRWQTVDGGSSRYVEAFRKSFRGEIRLNARVRAIGSTPFGATVTVENGAEETFDSCVICAHADQAIRLLEEPTPAETELLGAWRYYPNRAVLHTDAARLPANRRAWASWNYCREEDGAGHQRVSVTYHMNRLQGFQSAREYCVSLNPVRPIAAEHIVAEFDYEHPAYDAASVRTQARLAELQGRNRRYFAGSYFGYGFHEDAVRSAVEVAQLFGESL